MLGLPSFIPSSSSTEVAGRMRNRDSDLEHKSAAAIRRRDPTMARDLDFDFSRVAYLENMLSLAHRASSARKAPYNL